MSRAPRRKTASYREFHRPARRFWLFRLVSGLFKLAATMVTVSGFATLASVLVILYVPLPGGLPPQRPHFYSVPSVVTDINGTPIAVLRDFDIGLPFTPEDVPEVLAEAAVASEDARFYKHTGVDPLGISRALFVNYTAGATVQGGSTITQQVIKNEFAGDEVTLGRKMTEAWYARQLEQVMDKDQILYEYLASAYFGSGSYGAAAAARTYFRLPLAELNLSQAATLVGVIPSPTNYSPNVDMAAAERRRLLVLGRMLKVGYITQAEFDAAAASPLAPASPDSPPGATLVYPTEYTSFTAAPHFVNWVVESLEPTFGRQLFTGGLTIQTTLDLNLQQAAESTVRQVLGDNPPPLEMSIVSVEPSTGYVRAMVGGRDFATSQVNLATGGATGMQPGSSFKPFVLAAALESGATRPGEVFNDSGSFRVPGCVGSAAECSVRNYGGSVYGSVDLARATANSVNTVYTDLALRVGPYGVASIAAAAGVTSYGADRNYGASVALGAYEASPLDIASGYATFANHGTAVPASGVFKVFGPLPGYALLFDNSAPSGVGVMRPATADTVTELLRGVVENGTGTGARLSVPVAGKTGTAEDYQAAWFAGYVPNLSTAVWMGYSDAPRSLLSINGVAAVTGGSIPSSAFATYMSAALAFVPAGTQDAWPWVGKAPVPPRPLFA